MHECIIWYYRHFPRFSKSVWDHRPSHFVKTAENVWYRRRWGRLDRNLEGRSQIVKFNNKNSREEQNDLGVPQWSIISTITDSSSSGLAGSDPKHQQRPQELYFEEEIVYLGIVIDGKLNFKAMLIMLRKNQIESRRII